MTRQAEGGKGAAFAPQRGGSVTLTFRPLSLYFAAGDDRAWGAVIAFQPGTSAGAAPLSVSDILDRTGAARAVLVAALLAAGKRPRTVE